MQGHVRTHHPRNEFKCELCGKVRLIVLYSLYIYQPNVTRRFDISRYLLQAFERKDKWQKHVDGVHLKTTTVDCPAQCGHTASRYYTGYFLSNISYLGWTICQDTLSGITLGDSLRLLVCKSAPAAAPATAPATASWKMKGKSSPGKRWSAESGISLA